MIICDIEKVLEYGAFQLKCGSRRYQLVLEFHGVRKPKAADKLMIHEKLFNLKWEGYTQPYAFELVNDLTPKQVMMANDEEYIVLGSQGKNYVMKRIYG